MSRILIALLLAGSATAVSAAPQERGPNQARSARSAESGQSDRVERPRAERPSPRAERSERQQVRISREGESTRNSRSPVAIERRQPPRVEVERPVEPMERIRSRVRSRAPAAVQVERAEPVRPRLRGRAPAAVDVERSEPVEIVSPRGSVVRERRRAGRDEPIERRNLRRAPQIAEEARSGEDLVQQRRPLPRVLDRSRPETVARAPRFGTQAPEPATALNREARPGRRWSTDWRRDGRYNWHDYRRRHRRLFHLGFYYDPFGWDYFRYGIGWRLWPSHYGSRFWLHDPWMYRLPPAYGPYRWVRYWDDALLVNIYTGRVVDVIHNFFW